MKVTIERRKVRCASCGISAAISVIVHDGEASLIGTSSERKHWMSLPPGWFTSPSFVYLCVGCSLCLCGTEAKSLPTDLLTMNRLESIESKIDALTATIERGFMVEVSSSELPEELPSQGVTAAGSPWCKRCPDGDCVGLAVLAECDIRKGVPLPAPFDKMLTKSTEGEKP